VLNNVRHVDTLDNKTLQHAQIGLNTVVFFLSLEFSYESTNADVNGKLATKVKVNVDLYSALS